MIPFDEVQFPTNISYRFAAELDFNTTIVEASKGYEQRVARWSEGRHRFDSPYEIKDPASVQAIAAFYVARQGPYRGFRFKDWTDFTSRSDGVSSPTPLDQLVIQRSSTVFQLIKAYASGSIIRYRYIWKPVVNTVVAAVDGITVNGAYFTNNVGLLVGAISGSSSSSGAGYDITVEAVGLGGVSDKFYYIQKQQTGDGEVFGRVTYVDPAQVNSFCGVMFRNGTAANAIFVAVTVHPDNTVSFSYRSTTGGAVTTVGPVGGSDFKWVKINRTGDVFTGYYATGVTPISWSTIANVTIVTSSTLKAGAVAASGSDTYIGGYRIENLTVNSFSGIPADFTVDTTTGNITFSTAPSGTVTVGYEYDVPVTFAKELDSAIFLVPANYGTGSIDSIPMVEMRVNFYGVSGQYLTKCYVPFTATWSCADFGWSRPTAMDAVCLPVTTDTKWRLLSVDPGVSSTYIIYVPTDVDCVVNGDCSSATASTPALPLGHSEAACVSETWKLTWVVQYNCGTDTWGPVTFSLAQCSTGGDAEWTFVNKVGALCNYQIDVDSGEDCSQGQAWSGDRGTTPAPPTDHSDCVCSACVCWYRYESNCSYADSESSWSTPTAINAVCDLPTSTDYSTTWALKSGSTCTAERWASGSGCGDEPCGGSCDLGGAPSISGPTFDCPDCGFVCYPCDTCCFSSSSFIRFTWNIACTDPDISSIPPGRVPCSSSGTVDVPFSNLIFDHTTWHIATEEYEISVIYLCTPTTPGQVLAVNFKLIDSNDVIFSIHVLGDGPDLATSDCCITGSANPTLGVTVHAIPLDEGTTVSWQLMNNNCCKSGEDSCSDTTSDCDGTCLDAP